MNNPPEPCVEARTPALLVNPGRPGGRVRKELLLAEDSPSIRASLGKLFRAAGYEVRSVSDGGEVLEELARRAVDVLVLDLDMPRMDGWETLERVRSFKPGLPVVVITGHTGQGDWAQSEGAAFLMEKPLDLPLLLGTIHDLALAAATTAPGAPASAPTPGVLRDRRGSGVALPRGFACITRRWQGG